MTRDAFELLCGREGLTRPQTAAILAAADLYATAQAELACGKQDGPVVHYQDDFLVPACDRSGRISDPLVTLSRRHVNCLRCQGTRAYKEAS